MTEIKIEKGPGWDWLVSYEWEDGQTDDVAVFGCIKIEDAITEARHSLGAGGFGYAILAARRMES